MYWKTDAGNCITITRDIDQATVFHVIPSEDSDNTYDFNIGSHGKTLHQMVEDDYAISKHSKRLRPKIMRYLEMKTSWFGHSSGPLKLRPELSAKNARFCLYKQLEDDFLIEAPADITPWLEGSRVYFISSARRKSLIAIARSDTTAEGTEDVYTSKCVGSQGQHDEKSLWMLFRLIPADEAKQFCKHHHGTEAAPAAVETRGSKSRMSKEFETLLESTEEH